MAQSSPAPSGTPYESETPHPDPNGESGGDMGAMSATSTPSEIANGPSALPSMTPDGRYVAFDSHASNLTASDNPNSDVFVRDMNDRVATLISTDPIANVGGGSYSPDISGDGRYVAFHSFASFAGQDNNAGLDIYLRDLEESSTALVSKSSSGELANGPSDYPVITPDGRYVAFRSTATNLVAGDTNGQPDIFLRDLLNNTTERVSLTATGGQATGYTMNRISVSSDARYVAFESLASNLVPQDTNSDWDVFVRDRQAGTTTAVSVTLRGVMTGNLGSYFPSMSPDGRYVAFHAWSSNLVLNDSNNLPDVFVRDRQTNTTALVSQNLTTQGNGFSDYPAISSDGRYVAFRSFATNIVKGASSHANIFKKDLTTGAISLVSSFPGKGHTANAASARPDMSSDGSIVAFETDASNIVPNDTNGARDIVLRSTGFKGVTTMENAAPTASVDVSPTSGDISTAFEATIDITDPDGDPAGYYEVRWGDGQSSNYTGATHTYAAAGTYNVTAVVCDQFSLCSAPSSPVTVRVAPSSNQAPVASLNVTPSQGDLTTTFSANMDGTYDPDGETLSYSIDWGDGSVTEDRQGTHQYSTPGDYEIVGRVEDPFGSWVDDSQLVRVCAVQSGSTCVMPPVKVPGVCRLQEPDCESSALAPLELAQEIVRSVGLEATDRQLAEAAAEAQTNTGIRGPMNAVIAQVEEGLTQSNNIYTDELDAMTDKGQDEVVYTVAKIAYEKGEYGVTAEEIAVCVSSGKFAAFCVEGVGIRAEAWESSRYWYSTWESQDSPQDAYRHCIWSALLAKRTSYRFGELITTAHEPKPRSRRGQMDLHNNAHGLNAGRAGALNHEHKPALERRCIDLGENGILIRSLSDYRID